MKATFTKSNLTTWVFYSTGKLSINAVRSEAQNLGL